MKKTFSAISLFALILMVAIVISSCSLSNFGTSTNTKSTDENTNEQTNQSSNQSTNESSNQSTNESSNQSTNESTDETEDEPTDNVAIESLSYKTYLSGIAYEAVISNNSTQPRNIDITLVIDENEPISTSIYLQAEEKITVIFTPQNKESTDETIVLKIEGAEEFGEAILSIDNINDDNLEDNEASVIYVPPKEYKIQYVSDNFVLKDGALDTSRTPILFVVLRSCGYTVSSDSMYHSSQIDNAMTSGYDLYIYEGVLPETSPTDGAVWYINIPGAPNGIDITISGEKDATEENRTSGYEIEKSTITGDLAPKIHKNVELNPIITDEYTIIPSVSLYKIIGEVKPSDEGGIMVDLNLPQGLEPIYDAIYYERTTSGYKAVATPVMLAGNVNGTNVIITTFDFSKSSLSVFVTDFPILIRNMFNVTVK